MKYVSSSEESGLEDGEDLGYKKRRRNLYTEHKLNLSWPFRLFSTSSLASSPQVFLEFETQVFSCDMC